jgi:aryl-alcohol dehydrogenase-like predicted oxidoreductase
VVIATKFLPRTQDEIEKGITGQQHIENMIDTSLKNLGMDYVDACGIIGLNQESPINTGFERFGPFSLTRKAG